MYDLLGPVLNNGFFFLNNLMSVHNPAKFQHCGVIFPKSAVDTKNCLFFPYRALFFADTVDIWKDSATRFFTLDFFIIDLSWPQKICRNAILNFFEFSDLFVFGIPRNRVPYITDSRESKIEPWATHIIDSFRCSWWTVLYMQRWFFSFMSL